MFSSQLLSFSCPRPDALGRDDMAKTPRQISAKILVVGPRLAVLRRLNFSTNADLPFHLLVNADLDQSVLVEITTPISSKPTT